jgi:hypothetical protein
MKRMSHLLLVAILVFSFFVGVGVIFAKGKPGLPDIPVTTNPPITPIPCYAC